ncbi:MAG: sigma-70 family RNA polymerase sigma factor [Prevotellaceae bacterium]|nr:sigma-70 family RNA polymerase sigma factor [Prevotellaceae bacterium]
MAISDKDIIAALRTDTEAGFRLLVQKYREPIYWHIRRLVVAHADAQDAAQETFVRIFRSVDGYKGNTSLAAWIYRIATNEALRLIGRRQTQPTLSADDSAVADRLAADRYVDYADAEAVDMQRAILSLPPKQQVVFNLRFYDEMNYTDIAQVTGSNVAAVKVNYHLAKEKVKRRLLA